MPIYSSPQNPLSATTPTGDALYPQPLTDSRTSTVNATEAPFHGSGDSRTTTTVGITGTGTAVTLTADIGLSASQGVFIAGAGVGGIDYIGTVVSCSGTALVVTPATSTSVAAGAKVQHDNTAAIQGAMDYLQTLNGGRIWFPAGFYRVNGPIQDTAHAKSILQVPSVLYDAGPQPMPLVFEGPLPPPGIAFAHTTDTSNCAVIQTDVVYDWGFILGGYNNTAGIYGNLTNVHLNLKNIIFRTYDDPGIGAVGANSIATVAFDNLAIDTGVSQPVSCTFPQSHTAVRAIVMPGTNCALPTHGKTVSISGYANGVVLGEHSWFDYLYLSYCGNALVFATGFDAGASHVCVDKCTNALSGVCGALKICDMTVDQCDVLIDDAANALHGSVDYKAGTGTLTITGGTGLNLTNLATADVTIKGDLISPYVAHPYITGGTASTSGAYTVRTFTGNDTLVVYGAIKAQVLVVGGGGAGGGAANGANTCGEGGDAGVMVDTAGVLLQGVNAVVVGAAGVGVSAAAGGNGGASSIAGISAAGGAGGGNWIGSAPGHAGGDGAGGPGVIGTASVGGAGGPGVASTVTGASVIYAAGGGTGFTTGGAGGSSNVGGKGQNFNSTAATAGTANTGSGGGGAASTSNTAGANGAAGVVIIKYLT